MTFQEKHAPKAWQDLIFQDPDTAGDLNRYAFGKMKGSILLHGPYGSGKSETARLLVQEYYGVEDTKPLGTVVAFGADLDRKIDNWRVGLGLSLPTLIDPRLNTYTVIDEIDRYDTNTQVKLRGLIDDVKAFAHFIFTTNNIQNVDLGIRSRSDVYELPRPTPERFLPRALSICKEESIDITPTKLLEVLSSDGADVRDYLRQLEKLAIEVAGQ